jgi:hypothetical protein
MHGQQNIKFFSSILSRILFFLSNILTASPEHFNLLTRMCVARSVCMKPACTFLNFTAHIYKYIYKTINTNNFC